LLRLDGRFGFGVGAVHPTTRLCLEALEKRLESNNPEPSAHIADIGCGSGVLAISAILLGAKKVYAVDTKAAAVLGTEHNRVLNDIDPKVLSVRQGSVSDLKDMLTDTVDGFVCNILTRIIVHLIPRFKDISGPSTWGILSGIRHSELSYLEGPLEKHGWNTTGVQRDEGWCCLEICRA
jgi:ribosomal protein L11 methyltransferase